MTTIVKKGTNANCFRLKNGKLITLEPDVLVILTDTEFEMLMAEYGSFIKPRIITEANPNGCFLVNRKSNYVADMSKEVGEVKDGSSPVEVTEGVIKEVPVKEAEGSAKPKRGRRKKA